MGEVTMARDDEDAVHKVDTVPPPDGDSDAYSAETKVGPVTQDAWAELIRKAAEEGERNAKSGPASSARPRADRAPPSTRDAAPTSSVKANATDNDVEKPLPRIYSEEDDADDAATVLGSAAKPVQIPPAQAAPGHVTRSASPLAAPFGANPTVTPSSTPHVWPPLAAPGLQQTAVPFAASRPPVAPSEPARVSGSISHAPRPLAFPPGDPAVPVPIPRAPPRTGFIVIVAVCMAIFVIGVVAYVTSR